MLNFIKYFMLLQTIVVFIDCQKLNILRQSLAKNAQNQLTNNSQIGMKCDSNPCLNEAECLNTFDGDFRCVCEWGWTGKTCDICLTDCASNPCPIETRCRARYGGGYDCVFKPKPKCADGYAFDSSTKKCILLQQVQDFCPCLNDGECVKDSFDKIKCNCKAGFTGTQCEVDIDECALNRNACLGGICVDQRNTYYCLCSGNRIGTDCVNTIANPCTRQSFDRGNQFFPLNSVMSNTYVQCTGVGSLMVQRCPNGLVWNQQASTCANQLSQVQTGACQSFPCKNSGLCVENPHDGNFKCMCANGYTGEVCEQTIDYCASSPCKNNGKCSSHVGGYTCLCPDKIIDDCCCNGIVNPCPTQSELIPGLNNYFPHLYPNKFIHCNFDGRAFVRTCPKGQVWKQQVLSCVPNTQLPQRFTSTTRRPTTMPSTIPIILTTTKEAFNEQLTSENNEFDKEGDHESNFVDEQVEQVEFTLKPEVNEPSQMAQSQNGFSHQLVDDSNKTQNMNNLVELRPNSVNSLSNRVPSNNSFTFRTTTVVNVNKINIDNDNNLNQVNIDQLNPDDSTQTTQIVNAIQGLIPRLTTPSINSGFIPQTTTTFLPNLSNNNILVSQTVPFIENNSQNTFSQTNLGTLPSTSTQIIDFGGLPAENTNEENHLNEHEYPDYGTNIFSHNQNTIDFGHLPLYKVPFVNTAEANIDDYFTDEDFEYILGFLNQNETSKINMIDSNSNHISNVQSPAQEYLQTINNPYSNSKVPSNQQKTQSFYTNSKTPVINENRNQAHPFNPNTFLVPSQVKPISKPSDKMQTPKDDELNINGFSGADFREICIEANVIAEQEDRDVEDEDFLIAAKTVLDSKIIRALLPHDDFF